MFRLAATTAFGVALTLGAMSASVSPDWSEDERAMIASLSLGALGPLPADPSNRFADDPAAVALGRTIFGDPRFSSDGSVSCATCHQADRQFQDDLPLAKGVGTTRRRTMPIAGMGYSPFLFWDGRKDSLWSQALGPMESPVEHGGDRTFYARLVATGYKSEYEALFGPLPRLDHLPVNAGPVENPEAATAWQAMAADDRTAVSRVFANIGKAIAAYERSILPKPTRFDVYAEMLSSGRTTDILSGDEIAGLQLFIGKAECVNCHNGPLLSDAHFHNTGVPTPAGAEADRGRAEGAALLREDPFNCLGEFSDARPDECVEVRFMAAGPMNEGAFKTPSLRGAASRAPYMHAGQIATLEGVLHHYRTAPSAIHGTSELRPLMLSETELAQIAAFLATLEPVQAAGD